MCNVKRVTVCHEPAETLQFMSTSRTFVYISFKALRWLSVPLSQHRPVNTSAEKYQQNNRNRQSQ